MSKKIKLLDCTLRDGGCTNNFNFGTEDMNYIKAHLEDACLDVIELGYINDKKGSSEGRTQYDSIDTVNLFLSEKKPSIEYVVMMDYGTFNPDHIPTRSENAIDGIRLAFHKKDRIDSIRIAKLLLDKGYKVFMQPMLLKSYTQEEIRDLIAQVNKEVPKIEAIYIVDSFGQMTPEEVKDYAFFFDKKVNPNINLGFHAHNNIELANINAQTMLEFECKRTLYVDSSMMGIGKGAGNAYTEDLIQYMNKIKGVIYKLKPIQKCIEEKVKPYSTQFKWGVSPEYRLSSEYGCTPSYINFFLKEGISVSNLPEVLKLLDPDKKVYFDEEHAQEIYKRYKSKIKLFVMDVDGCLTDGSLYIGENGEVTKAFNVYDGMGIKLLMKNEVVPVIITGRNDKATKLRAEQLDINEFYDVVDDKLAVLDEILIKYNCTYAQVACIGDDINDLPLLRNTGLKFIPKNAHQSVDIEGVYKLEATGGNGAIREVCDIIIERNRSIERGEELSKYGLVYMYGNNIEIK